MSNRKVLGDDGVLGGLDPTPEQARALFRAGGFLILSSLPSGSDFGVDTRLWSTAPRFEGVKFIPPGLHLFTTAPNPAPAPAAPPGAGVEVGVGVGVGVGVPVRSGFLRFCKPREVLLRRYDPESEAIEWGRAGEGEEAAVVSEGGLRTLDPGLAPYPLRDWELWKRLVRWVDEGVVGVVLEVDGRGDARVDGLMGSDSELGSGGLRVWGKPRPKGGDDAERPAATPQRQHGGAGGMRWPAFDLKRSWPADATGALLTAHSRDKSWLLRSVVLASLPAPASSDPHALIGLLQLAFVLGIFVQNASALDFHRRLLTALAYAPAMAAEAPPGSPALYSDLLDALEAQLAALRPEFFAVDAPAEQAWWLDALGSLRKTLSCVVQDGLVGDGAAGAWATRWASLARTARERFAWELEAELKRSAVSGHAQQEETEEEDEEDRPVVVQLD